MWLAYGNLAILNEITHPQQGVKTCEGVCLVSRQKNSEGRSE